MNIYRLREKQQDEKELDMLAFELRFVSDKYSFIESWIDPRITEYQSKWGITKFITHYESNIFQDNSVERN